MSSSGDSGLSPDATKPDHLGKQHKIIISMIILTFLGKYSTTMNDWKVAERFGMLILASIITEHFGERFKLSFDFGFATYMISLVYPPVFPLMSYNIKMHSSNIPIYSDLQATLLGTEYTLRFRRDVDFTNIMSEHKAMSDIGLVERETRKSHYIRESFVCLALVIMFMFLHGNLGVMIGIISFACYLLVQMQENKDEQIFTQNVQTINERKGVYAIETSNLWAEHHVGVGYLENGTFTTKYHITNGKPISINGRHYEASYYNTETDIVTYGAPPCLVDVNDGDDIVVALSGPFSDVIVNYTTKVSVNEDGYVMFTGRKSIPGTSGSPFFKVENEDGLKVFKFAGCLGWTMKDSSVKENEIIEIAKNTGIGDSNTIGRSEIVQLITHPGSGKTHDISKVVQAGLNIYGRVYAAGPTRGVANELLKAYERNPIEGLVPRVLIKDTRKARAPSKLTISTHGTLLSMLLKRDTSVTQPGLWILDESHFPDRNTQALKHLLRHSIKNGSMKASLYEMTATAYDIKMRKWAYADSSNYPIKDTLMRPDQMVESILEETRKSIVFVTAIDGIKPSTSSSLARELKSRGKRVIEINRGNFTTSYPKAKTGDFDVVLTTNISECGVNLDAEVCYDFQKNPRPLVYRWDDIKMEIDDITIGQYVQRRGRIGRRKEGEYIAPKSKYELSDVRAHDAMHLDLALFLRNFGITPMEPVYLEEEAQACKCSHEQIMYLFAGGESHTIQSPLTLQMVIDANGNLRTSEALMDHVRRWSNTASVERNRGDIVVTAQYWDDRDGAFYWQWKDLLDLHDRNASAESIPNSMRKKIFTLTKALKMRGMWIKSAEASGDRTPDESPGEISEEGETSDS